MSPFTRSLAPSRVRFGAVIGAVVLVSCTSGGDDSLDVPGVDNEDQTTFQAEAPTAASTTLAVDPVPLTTSPPVTQAPVTAPPDTAPPTTPAPTTTVETTTVATTIPEVDGPYYRIGDEGPEVSILQLKLQTVGFLDPGFTDGVFDGATNDAVIAFQGQYGLIVDGVVGPATDGALTAAALSVAAET